MFKHILLPTDGSKLSEASIRNGITLAKKIGAKVTGLCAVPSQNHFYLVPYSPRIRIHCVRG
jgi:nucleotide-binding universal stress UspA family protein